MKSIHEFLSLWSSNQYKQCSVNGSQIEQNASDLLYSFFMPENILLIDHIRFSDNISRDNLLQSADLTSSRILNQTKNAEYNHKALTKK